MVKRRSVKANLEVPVPAGRRSLVLGIMGHRVCILTLLGSGRRRTIRADSALEDSQK